MPVYFIPALGVSEQDMRVTSQHGRHRMWEKRLHFLETLDQRQKESIVSDAPFSSF